MEKPDDCGWWLSGKKVGILTVARKGSIGDFIGYSGRLLPGCRRHCGLGLQLLCLLIEDVESWLCMHGCLAICSSGSLESIQND